MTQTTREKRALLQRAIDEGLEVEYSAGEIKWAKLQRVKFIGTNGAVVELGQDIPNFKTRCTLADKYKGDELYLYIENCKFRIADTVTADMLAEAIDKITTVYTEDKLLIRVDRGYLNHVKSLAAQYRKQKEERC